MLVIPSLRLNTMILNNKGFTYSPARHKKRMAHKIEGRRYMDGWTLPAAITVPKILSEA